VNHYSYLAYERSGGTRRGQIEAASEGEAREKLSRQGLFVTEVRATRGDARETGGDAGAGAPWKIIRRLSHLTEFSRQLSVLVSTGTPLVQALTAVERQASDTAWRKVLRDVRERVEQGSSLAEAMREHPVEFDALTRSLVSAGESAGNMPEMLRRLGSIARQRQKTVQTVMGAMVYPSLLIAVSFVVIVVMLVFVVPRFAGMFESLDAELPATTAFLLATGDLLRAWWFAIVPAGLALPTGGYFWINSPRGRRFADRALVTLPVIGPVARSLSLARIARLLGVLLTSHVKLLEALELTRLASRNSLYRELLSDASEKVTTGEDLARVFTNNRLVPPAFAETIRNGEQTGRLGEALTGLSEFMDEDNETAVKSLTALIEPAILIVLGLVVGFVALSLFLPLFDLTAMAGGPK
jgi:type II secretory pathway component PulF